jgi:hypothetical protein
MVDENIFSCSWDEFNESMGIFRGRFGPWIQSNPESLLLNQLRRRSEIIMASFRKPVLG